MLEEYLPKFHGDAFHCPKCKVLVPQKWYRVQKSLVRGLIINLQEVDPNNAGPRVSSKNQHHEWDLEISVCTRCNNYTVWENENIIHPKSTSLPEASEDMPSNIKNIYEEAVNVYNHSPRASAALLRLAIETMIPQLDDYNIEKAKLNTMIGELVKVGIPEHVQQGLDAIRVYGNEGIHPAEITLSDNQDNVLYLFSLINIMVEELITRKKNIESFYNKLPPGKIEGILNRDGSTK